MMPPLDLFLWFTNIFPYLELHHLTDKAEPSVNSYLHLMTGLSCVTTPPSPLFPNLSARCCRLVNYPSADILFCSQILIPWLGDKVDSGIGLSYRPARLHRLRLAGWYDNPMPESTLSPSQGLRIWLLVAGFDRPLTYILPYFQLYPLGGAERGPPGPPRGLHAVLQARRQTSGRKGPGDEWNRGYQP